VYENGILVHRDGDTRHPVLSASEIPLTIDGAALHNVSNALGAMAVASSLGVSYQVMAEALREFGSEWEDNPGRCQRAEIGGVNLIFDFGHNPHGIQAILGMARRLLERKPGARLGVSIGQAGDRSDRDIFNLAKSIWSADPSLVLARDIPGYERGREPGEVARLLQHHLVGLGMSKGCVQICDSELAALEAGFSWAEPGDILVTLVHLQREQVQDWLEERGATRR
jgi:UDP-N-acetylmuramyl tripeptide synthase